MSTHTVPSKGKICVTGANGFIGVYVTELLFEHGYHVRAVVRDAKNEDKLKAIKSLPHKEGQLEFFEADISSNKFEEVFQGCDAVIHLASPYLYTAPDPQKDIVDPAVNGAKGVILAAAKVPSIKRVVFTSSGGSVFHFPVPDNYVFTQKDWNTTASLTSNPYFFSKKLAEEAAWNLWQDHKDKFDLVVVNPTLVFGGPKGNQLNASQTNLFKKILTGESKSYQPGAIAVTHVADVAKAHVIALEQPKAVGQRLFCYSETVTWKKIGAEMKKQFPDYPIHVEKDEEKPTWTIDTTPLRELGMTEFKSFESMVKDTVEGMIAVGAIPDLRK